MKTNIKIIKQNEKKPTTQIELHSTQARRDLFWKAMTF